MPLEITKNKLYQEMVKLKKYQSGGITLLKTNRPHIDDTLGGLLPGDIVTLAGASGAGKTYELQTLRENIMSVDINPDANDYVFADFSFEMKLFNLILRGMSKALGKKKKDVLLKEFTEEEKPLAQRYFETLSDDRFYMDENPCTADDFYTTAREFLLQHTDKKAVVIAIDHMGLFLSNGDKKLSIDQVVSMINLLKREFGNVYFIILSQLNRNILTRIKDNDILAMPNRADLYQSDTMFHISDYLIVVNNPNRLGIGKYLKVSPEKYDMLDHFFAERTGTSEKVAFETYGNIFYHVLKVREGDIVFQDIYIEEIISEELSTYGKEKVDVVSVEDHKMDTAFDVLKLDDEEDAPF